MATRTDRGQRVRRRAIVAAWVSAGLGFAHAGISAYWLAGGHALLDTVGGDVEEWGRSSDWTALSALTAVVAIKAGAAVLALVITPGRWSRRQAGGTGRGFRRLRMLAGVSAVILTGYGGVLTVVGLMVQADVVAAADADRHALAWHAYFWDPWFLCWGLALAAALWWSRPLAPAVTPPGTVRSVP